ncbi:MAG: hypothetical protein FJ405_04935 [Verrucomicrobia bacterium]|nr:hypothetical protein [Verrucomicrobiota bacterium]
MNPYIIILIRFAAVLLCGSIQSMEAADDDYNSWYPVPSLANQFSIKNHTGIVSDSKAIRMPSAEIRGLEIKDDSAAHWPMLANRMTNVAWLQIMTTNVILSTSLLASVTNFERVEFLHIVAKQAIQVPDSVSLLTNLTSLKYLGLVVPKATNISARIYGLATLREIFLRVDSVALPDGISNLHRLQMLRIHSSLTTPIIGLPLDLAASNVRHLEIFRVPNLPNMLPRLPKQVIGLYVFRCKLDAFPSEWLSCSSIQALVLGKNEFTTFPSELLALPSLKRLSLELNKITNVPPLKLSDDRQLKIHLKGNPIEQFASENEPLVQHGVLQK